MYLLRDHKFISIRKIMGLTGVFLLALCVSFSAQAQHGKTRDVAGMTPIEVSLSHALESRKVNKRALFDHVAIQEFYQARGQKPFWVGEQGVNGDAQTLYDVIEASWMHGLNPKTYHFQQISALWGSDDYQSKAQLELLLTDSFLRYARDMSGMRVPASALRLDARHWKQRQGAVETLALLSGHGSVSRVLTSIEPKGATYNKLKKELVRMVETGALDVAPVHKITLNGILRPGNSHRSILQFRKRLGLPIPTRGKYSYDKELVAAITAFQRANGLPDDGVIGSQTVAMLNRSPKDKMYQIIANMERFRWVDLPSKDDGRFVVVNIPSATLWAIDDGDVALEMPVIVGKPERATRSFVTQIEGVRLNPTWTVPPTIKRSDILPKLKQDVSYLENKGIDLLRGYGSNTRRLDPNSIDWEEIKWQELRDIRMVQKPGNHNALGRYRVLMPNKHNIYLHDTNKKQYFSSPNRALSSGCVRMKHPDKMTDFILDAHDDWSKRRTKDVLYSGKKTDVEITQPIPVYLLYYTAWAGENGRIVLGHDVYKQDRKLIKLLRSIDGFFIPRQNG